MPKDLIDVLTLVALASPAVVMLRTFNRYWSELSIETLFWTAQVADGFRSMFNLPETNTLLRGINSKEPYWMNVLSYCADGNLQAIMDEYVHVLYEALGLPGLEWLRAIGILSETIKDAVSIKTNTLSIDNISVRGNRVNVNTNRIRCRFTLKFGKWKDDVNGYVNREGQVKNAFN